MSATKLLVNEYTNSNGKYQVSIVPNPEYFGSYHSMGGFKVWQRLPKQWKDLQSLGFTNESRDLYLKEFDFPLSYDSKAEAKQVAGIYKAVLNGLIIKELK